MKKLIGLLTITALLIAGLNSCQKDEVQIKKSNDHAMVLKAGHENLFMSKDIGIGDVEVGFLCDEGPISVEIDFNGLLVEPDDPQMDDWYIEVVKAHIYVGEDPPAKPAPGQFPYHFYEIDGISIDYAYPEFFFALHLELIKYVWEEVEVEVDDELVMVWMWVEYGESAWLLEEEGYNFYHRKNGQQIGWGQYHYFEFCPPPVIDGVLEDGEWDAAAVIDVTSAMGTVYVMQIDDYLYVAMDILDDTDARLGQNLSGNDQVGFNINPTNGAAWGSPYDIIFQTGADPAAWGGTNSGMIDDWYTQWSVENTQLDLPDDVESVTIYSGGRRVTEWKIPLLGYTPIVVGGAIEVGDGNSYTFPVGLNWSDYSTFFVLP